MTWTMGQDISLSDVDDVDVEIVKQCKLFALLSFIFFQLS